VDQELDDSMMHDISSAFAAYARKQGHKTMLLGYDNRQSSLRFSKIASEALLSSGCNVINLGLVITPIFYFAAKHLDIKAGIMITASHNPANYNGCKILLGDSTIYGEQIQEIAKMAFQKEFIADKAGTYREIDLSDTYIKMIKAKIKLGKNTPKIVVDCGNGTASAFAPRLYRELGCEVIELYCESDPSFPNHHPDPVRPENMQDLIKEVKRTQADIGIGIDGDGDRLGVVDAQGNMIWGDQLMILYWREILKRYPGSTCIVEVKCSQSLIDEIKRLGGKPYIYKTGHSLIKAKMKELGAVFTGEMSGHMFFADEYYGFDDALYAGARLLRILSNSEKNITEMLADIPQYYATPEIRLPSTEKEKFLIVEQARDYFKKYYELIDIDGARIIFPHGWGLLRASNTGPEIIFRCEGDSPTARDEIKKIILDYLQSIGYQVADNL